MSGLRKVALLLASLRDDDRAWMLSRLDDVDRGRLVTLVDELNELGLAFDARAVDELVRQAPEPDPGQPRAIDRSDPGAVYAVLRAEPDAVIALVLAAGRWGWRDGFLRQLGTERRRLVQRALHDLRPAPRAAQALVAALDECLAQRRSAGPDAEARGQGVGGWLRRRLGREARA